MPNERRPAKVRSGSASGAGGANNENGRIRAGGRATKGLTRVEARKIALSIEGASEGPYFGKPSVFVNEKFLTRVHTKEEAMVLAVGSMEMRDVMLEAEPTLFYYLLARLSALDKPTLKLLLEARLLQIGSKAGTKKKRTGPKPSKKSFTAR